MNNPGGNLQRWCDWHGEAPAKVMLTLGQTNLGLAIDGEIELE